MRMLTPDPVSGYGYVGQLWALSASNGGAVPPTDVIGSVPSWWEPDGTDATFVRVGGSAPRIFRLHWRSGTIEALGGQAIANPLETPLTPVSDSTLFGFNPGAVNVVRATVQSHRIVLRNAAGESVELTPTSR